MTSRAFLSSSFWLVILLNLHPYKCDVKEWAKLQESLLKSQLTIIREFLRREKEPTFKPRKKGGSQMIIIYDILKSSATPLHISEILARAKDKFNVDLDRESVVSAMSKKSKVVAHSREWDQIRSPYWSQLLRETIDITQPSRRTWLD